MRNQILQGDVLDQLKKLADKSINCVGTSPPYYGLRDYGLTPTDWPEVSYSPLAGLPPITIPAISYCLGMEDSIEAYVGHMVLVWRELWRVLRDDGVCWLNLGDSYSSGGSGQNFFDPENKRPGGGRAKNKGDYGHIKTNRNPSSIGLKPKNLMGIPWRVALALQADGWYLRSDIIWHKKNLMPESVTDRPTKAHEYVFLLAKRERYWYDQDAIREMATDKEYRTTGRQRPNGTKGVGMKGFEIRGGLDSTQPNISRNKRTVWNIATKPYKEAHFAVFPEALVELWILAGCPARVCVECGEPWVRVVEREADNSGYPNGPGGRKKQYKEHNGSLSSVARWATKTTGFAPTCTCNATHRPGIVLDPFFGSGTVGVVAEKLKRRWVGIELNPDYVELAQKRIAQTQPALFAR